MAACVPSEDAEEAAEWVGELAIEAEAEESEDVGEAVANGFTRSDRPVADTMKEESTRGRRRL
jgi:hypothetical protein